jgi:hypothetical protein
MGLILLIPLPLGVAVIWGSTVLVSRPFIATIAGALGWLIVSHALLPGEIVWQLAGNVAAGVAAGLALVLRWRLDGALALVAVLLLPLIIWAMMEVPLADQFAMVREEMLRILEENLPASASQEQRQQALAEEARNLDKLSAPLMRIFPFLIGVGLLGQAGIILTLVWFVVRRLGMKVNGWSLPPFSRWRLPFYLVWLLVLGVGLMLTRAPYLATAGLNLALLAACVMSVQGIAVQWHVTSRLLSGMGMVLYWVVMGFFFAPLILVSGTVIGLIDQWADLRRLEASPEMDDLNAG